MKCKETFPTCLRQTDAQFSLLLMCVCCAPVSVETWQVAPGRDMTFIFYIKNQQDNSAPETNICRGPGARIFFGAMIFIFYIKSQQDNSVSCQKHMEESMVGAWGGGWPQNAARSRSRLLATQMDKCAIAIGVGNSNSNSSKQ